MILLTLHRIYYGITIAFAIHSVDHSLFSRLIHWSASGGKTLTKHIFEPSLRAKDELRHE